MPLLSRHKSDIFIQIIPKDTVIKPATCHHSIVFLTFIFNGDSTDDIYFHYTALFTLFDIN